MKVSLSFSRPPAYDVVEIKATVSGVDIVTKTPAVISAEIAAAVEKELAIALPNRRIGRK